MNAKFGFGKQQARGGEGKIASSLKTLFNPVTYISLVGLLANFVLIDLPARAIEMVAPWAVTWVQKRFEKNPPKSVWHPLYLFSKPQYVAQLMRDHYKDSSDPLLADRIDEAREARYPKDQNKDLWMSLRSDMDPGIIVESRLIDGSPLSEMHKVYATDKVINTGFELARSTGARRVIAAAIGLMVAFGVIFAASIDTFMPARDAWDEGAITTVADFLVLTVPWVIGLALATVLNPFAYASSALNGLVKWLHASAKNIHYAVSAASMPFRRSTKQSIVGAKRFAARRQIERRDSLRIIEKNDSYLKENGLDRSVKIGTATGEFRAEGASAYATPMPNQEVRMDLEALTKGVAVIGQTGSGKTSNVLLPMFRSLLAQQERGWMIMDGKAVLWLQCEELVKKFAPERAKDMVVIGTGTYNGAQNFGVDLLKGMRPSQVSETARSVMEQLSSSVGGDDYWPTSAAQLIEHAARLAEAFSITADGIAYEEKTGKSPYSLMFIYDMIKKVELRENVGEAIIRALNGSKGKDKVGKALYGKDHVSLMNSLRYMCRKGSKSEADTFAGMGDGQKSGVIGNVDKLLGNLFGHKELRQRFTEGRSEHTIDVDGALRGKIVAINISTEETGNAGAFVMTLLKSRLYGLAVMREREFKMEGRNPQIDAPVMLMIDEAQDFVSSSKSIGLDEGNALNKLRSTGLNVVFGFQTFASIVKRLGKDTTDDLMAQLTNKVIMANSDQATMDWVVQNSGATLRLGAHKEEEFENIWQNFSEHMAPSSPDEIDDLLEKNPEMMDAKDIQISYQLHNPLSGIGEISAYRGISEVDQIISSLSGSMMSMAMGSGSDNKTTKASMQVQQLYREEDKAEAYMTQGNETRKILDPSDISGMAEGKAWATWSTGGIVKTDLIYLDEAIH